MFLKIGLKYVEIWVASIIDSKVPAWRWGINVTVPRNVIFPAIKSYLNPPRTPLIETWQKVRSMARQRSPILSCKQAVREVPVDPSDLFLSFSGGIICSYPGNTPLQTAAQRVSNSFFVDIQKLSAEKFRVSPICFSLANMAIFSLNHDYGRKSHEKSPLFRRA